MTTLDDAVALYSNGQPEQALALALREAPALLNVAAAAAYALGLREEAGQHWRMVLSLNPQDCDAHNNLGLLLAESGQPQQAEASYRQALAAHPGHAPAWNNLGIVLEQQGRPGEAEAAYRRALAFKPGYPEALNNLGNLLKDQGQFAEAEALLRQALALRPSYAEACYNLGNLLRKTDRHEEAEAALRQALALRPAYPEALNNLGVLLEKSRRYAEAEQAYRDAIALRPDYADAYNNLGIELAKTERLTGAEAAYRQALALHPSFPNPHINLGILYNATGRFAEAEAAFRQALALRPGCVVASYNLSFLLLSQGRFQEGWRLQETRYHPDQPGRPVIAPALPYPQWQGEPLQGRSVLVLPEQGHGDEIQFCRLAPQLKALGAAKVGLGCKAPLAPLLATLDGIDALHPLTPGQDFEGYDYWVFLLSLPAHLGLGLDTIPARLPYLSALPERIAQWQPRLPPTRPRVGLAWKGLPSHANDARRSLPGLGTLAPLWEVPGISFVSLQKGSAEDEALNPPPGLPLAALGQDAQDFADTAAIIAQLDLVICVDTAIAHLCGALGRPCWVLLSHPAEWRWLQDREDSPWYPGALRLFRQGLDEAWDAVAGRLALALQQWNAAR